MTMQMARRVALIDESVESSLFSGESALGKTVEIQGYPFTVVGVVTEKDSYDLVINSMDDYYMYAHDDSQGNVFVPNGTWPVIFGYDEPQNLLLKADSTDTMATVGKAAEEILNSNLNVTDGSDAGLQGTGFTGAGKADTAAQPVNQHDAHLDCRNITAGRWYRCHEYHACVSYRAYLGDRT